MKSSNIQKNLGHNKKTNLLNDAQPNYENFNYNYEYMTLLPKYLPDIKVSGLLYSNVHHSLVCNHKPNETAYIQTQQARKSLVTSLLSTTTELPETNSST